MATKSGSVTECKGSSNHPPSTCVECFLQVGYDQVRVDEARIVKVVFDSRPKRNERRQLSLERIPPFLRDTTKEDPREISASVVRFNLELLARWDHRYDMFFITLCLSPFRESDTYFISNNICATTLVNPVFTDASPVALRVYCLIKKIFMPFFLFSATYIYQDTGTGKDTSVFERYNMHTQRQKRNQKRSVPQFYVSKEDSWHWKGCLCSTGLLLDPKNINVLFSQQHIPRQWHPLFFSQQHIPRQWHPLFFSQQHIPRQ